MIKMRNKKSIKHTYNNAQIAALMDAFNKSHLTITRWIKNNDDRLTSEKAKEALLRLNNG